MGSEVVIYRMPVVFMPMFCVRFQPFLRGKKVWLNPETVAVTPRAFFEMGCLK